MFGPAGLPLSLLLYVFALEPLLPRLRDEGTCLALHRISLAGSVHILAVRKVDERYENVAGAKVNFDKSEGLRLGAWKRGGPPPGPFRWSNGPILEV